METTINFYNSCKLPSEDAKQNDKFNSKEQPTSNTQVSSIYYIPFTYILTLTYSNSNNPTSNPLSHYVGEITDSINLLSDTVIKVEDSVDEDKILAQFPILCFGKYNSIKIPSKSEYYIKKYMKTNLLYAINKNLDVARELCLIFLSNLADSYYRINGIGFTPDEKEKEGWKNLQSIILDKQLGEDNNSVRRKITKALIAANVIECDYVYEKGSKSYSYRLTSAYKCKGAVSYEIRTEFVKSLLLRNYYKRLAEVADNSICRNLLHLYANITLPTTEEIITEAKKLIKEGWKNNKGKKLTFLNKQKKDYWRDADKRSFVEDSIELFEYYTVDGLVIPSPCGEKGGNRVVDTFTLIPSWIRNIVKINGKKIVVVDYSCLHPNIAVSLYSGKKRYITHQDIAIENDIDVKEVKVAHLSLFNDTINGMTHSVLYPYYKYNEKEMMANILQEKTEKGYKITSMKMFKREVELMTAVIERLNKEGIYVGYVYDALFCLPDQEERVKQVMNEVAIEMKIFTTAK